MRHCWQTTMKRRLEAEVVTSSSSTAPKVLYCCSTVGGEMQRCPASSSSTTQRKPINSPTLGGQHSRFSHRILRQVHRQPAGRFGVSGGAGVGPHLSPVVTLADPYFLETGDIARGISSTHPQRPHRLLHRYYVVIVFLRQALLSSCSPCSCSRSCSCTYRCFPRHPCLRLRRACA